MADFTALNTIISDLFGVISTLINETVTLITGDLLVLAVVGAILALILSIVYSVITYIKSHMKFRKN